MDLRIKKLWLKALRSGDYEQTKGTLRSNVGFCCLGVLCNLAEREGIVTSNLVDAGASGSYYTYGERESDSVLPIEVRNWAKTEDDPMIDGESLSEWNDAKGYDFKQIADLIEKGL